MRNLDIHDDIVRRRTFYYKGEENGVNVEHYILINKTDELVVILEDGKEVASLISKKVFTGTSFDYEVDTAGEESKLTQFFSDEKGVEDEGVLGLSKDLVNIWYKGRLYNEFKANKKNCEYDLKKVSNLTYTSYNKVTIKYSESYKEDKLETLPIEALKENFIIKKSGNTYVRVYEKPKVNKYGASIKDEFGDIIYEPYNFSWAENKKYRILIEDDEIEEFIEGLSKTKEVVGFDTETTGLAVHKLNTDKLVGICISYEDDTGVYFPLEHNKFENVKMGREALLNKLKPYCDSRSVVRKDLVLHNGGFDWKVMKMYGWDLNITHDTLILQALNDISTANNMLSLKAISKHLLGLDTLDLGEIFYKLSKDDKDNGIMDFRYIPYEIVEFYAGADADLPRLLYKLISQTWDESLDFIYGLEIATIKALSSQEYEGIRIDLEKFKELSEETKVRLLELEEEIYELVGESFNIKSSKQKSEILYGKLGIPKLPRFRTKSGGYQTNKEMLEHFSEVLDKEGNKKYPVLDKMIEYSKKSQALTLFYDKIPTLEDRGHLFTNFRQVGTESGRISSNKPNLQQTEPKSRMAMLPTSDDYYFIICDYSQVEYRLSAGLNGEQKVVDFFSNNPEADYHILAYSNMMGIPYNEVTSSQRSEGKVLNFALSYGLQDQKLALKLYGDDSPFYQRKASKMRDKYFDGVPKIRENMRKVEEDSFKRGYVRTLFGRKRGIPEYELIHKHGETMSDFRINKLRGDGDRKASNTYVQGTAADIMKMAMVNCYNFFTKNDLDVKLILNVHDELCFQVNKKYNMWYIIKKIRECMEIDLRRYNIPPLYIGANVGYSWFDGKVDELEAPVLLMDKKGKEVEELLKEIQETKNLTEIEAIEYLPTTNTPREEFAEDIQKFMVEVLLEEIERNNYEDVLSAKDDQRIGSYLKTYYSGDANRLLQELIKTKDSEYVYSKLEELINSEPLVIEEVKESKVIEESMSTIQDKIKRTIHLDKKGHNKVMNVYLEEFDKTLYESIRSLVVPYEMLEVFKEDVDYYRLVIHDVQDDLRENVSGYIPSFFGGIIYKLLLEHFTKGLKGNDMVDFLLNEEYDNIGSKYIKEEYL